MRQIGEMLVIGRPSQDLEQALGVAATHLHPTFDNLVPEISGWSKTSCVNSALCLAKFLHLAGFHDARPTPVFVIMRQLGEKPFLKRIGSPNGHPLVNGWNGHMVVVADGFVIDPTANQLRTDETKALPGFIASPILKNEAISGFPALAGFQINLNSLPVSIAWLDAPNNLLWKQIVAADKDGAVKKLRTKVANALAAHAGIIARPVHAKMLAVDGERVDAVSVPAEASSFVSTARVMKPDDVPTESNRSVHPPGGDDSPSPSVE